MINTGKTLANLAGIMSFKSGSSANLLSLRLNQLTEKLNDIDKDNSLSDEEKEKQKTEIQAEIEGLHKQIDEKEAEESKKIKKKEQKKKVERIKEEINSCGNAKAKKRKAQEYMMQGMVGSYGDVEQISNLTKLKEEVLKAEEPDTQKLEIIDKMLKEAIDSYESNTEVAKKATRAFLDNDKKVKEKNKTDVKNKKDNNNIDHSMDIEISKNSNAFFSLDLKV